MQNGLVYFSFSELVPCVGEICNFYSFLAYRRICIDWCHYWSSRFTDSDYPEKTTDLSQVTDKF